MVTPRSSCLRLTLALGLFGIGLFGVVSNVHGDWPQFRGPNCAGIASGNAALPTEFSSTKNVKWTQKLGDGVGCPIVAANRVFVTAMVDETTLGLFAFDATSGKRLWKRQWDVGKLPPVHKTNSHASTTPAADAERVYLYFSTLGLITVDAANGRDVWHRKMPTPFFVFKWGPAMSPVVYKDLVIFCQDDDLFPAMYALNKRTGKIVWKDDRSDMAVNYSHPVIARANGKDELVVAGTGLLVGYDPMNGKRLWKARVLLRNIKTTPVVSGDMIYISLQSSGIANQWLATADRSETGNNDGKLSKAEMQAFVGKEVQIPDAFYKRTFDKGDLNKDGFLEGAELDAAFLNQENFAGARFDAKKPADEFVMAVRAGGRGDVTKTHLVWKHPTRHTDHIVSPYVQDGRMLLIKEGGIMTVFHTKNGKPAGEAKRIRNSGQYFASPVGGDGKIYVAGENGKVVVLKNGPNFEVLARNDLDDSLVATPAISNGRIYFRGREKLICVGK